MLELKQELDENPETGMEAVARALERLAEADDELVDTVEGFEGPSQESADALDDATGYDSR